MEKQKFNRLMESSNNVFEQITGIHQLNEGISTNSTRESLRKTIAEKLTNSINNDSWANFKTFDEFLASELNKHLKLGDDDDLIQKELDWLYSTGDFLIGLVLNNDKANNLKLEFFDKNKSLKNEIINKLRSYKF